MSKPIYVLGTGLSHNGSAVLLKDGKICVAIEKERISRIKHHGGNDTAAIQYCLDAEGISVMDLSLVVQTANFEIPDKSQFHGKRLFADCHELPFVTISHHLAHAYSAVGTCQFDQAVVMVIDGCGSPIDQCTDLVPNVILNASTIEQNKHQMWCEKDSFYFFDGKQLTPLLKDFSPIVSAENTILKLPTTQHSIGGFYAAISHYVFGNMDDVGKLMGLAPYGRSGFSEKSAFEMVAGSLYVRNDWQSTLTQPSTGYVFFKEHFQYYADVAFWAQNEVEKAVRMCFEDRLKRFPNQAVCYSGGVALNAVANAALLNDKVVENLYIEPAAGDNGLALGCAFYGWLEVLKKEKVTQDENTCFGKKYTNEEIEILLEKLSDDFSFQTLAEQDLSDSIAAALTQGKTIAWFQDHSEFGPRALGHRSILAHPSIPGLGDHINAAIKFREDFRPFAPAVLPEFAKHYFVSGRKSPYMILVDQTKESFKTQLQNVTHVNGTARVQTVDKTWNNRFYHLIKSFHQKTGIAVLLNTSFNKKGMPIVETPNEAIELFKESALDILVLNLYVVEKKRNS